MQKKPQWPLAAATVALAALVLAGSSGPALAYAVASGGFADGTDSRLLVFAEGTTQLTGPSLRLLTNSTVTSASMLVAGRPGYTNSSTTETTTADFQSSSLASNLSIQGGSLSLAPASAVLVFSAANSFGNATWSGTHVVNATAVLNATASGSLLTEAVEAPAGGWGSLQARVTIPAGATLQFYARAPGGGVVGNPIEIGAVIDVDPILFPTLQFEAALGAGAGGASPAISEIRLGQQTGDRFVGAGVARTLANVSFAADGNLTLKPNFTSFVKHWMNPVLPVAASTWHAGMVNHPNIIRVGNAWWAYMTGASCYGCAGHIGRAVSSDLSNWTFDPQPLLNGTAATWTANSVDLPFVMENPVGSGYLMYFAATNGAIHGIGLATSPDGVTWTEYGGNPILLPSASGWDNYYVSDVGAVRYDNGTWTMWYNGGRSGEYASWGVATSTDGRSWTKYASNPVVAPSPGPDQLAITEGNVFFHEGTFYMYYTCSANVGWHPCLATSPDGYAWTKFGWTLSAGGGWEGQDTSSPFVLFVNGSLVMFYTGWQPPTRTQSGRADSTWSNGVVRGTFDFGLRRPASLDRLTVEGTTPGGTGLEVKLRSSPDGTTWTPFESLALQSTTISTPPNRFVEYVVYLNGTQGRPAPTLAGVTLDYHTLSSQGRYESSAFPYGDTISGARAAVSFASGGGNLAVEFSTDNRTTWTRVTNGTFAALPLNSTALHYALVFEGLSYSGPTVDAVDLLVQRWGSPRDVSVRIGSNGSPFFNAPGALDVAVNVSIPAADLNAAIQAALAVSPGAASVDVPLFVNSTHFGLVELLEPRVAFVLKNPLSATFQPTSTAVTMDENATALFAVAATGYPDTVPINISWQLDGSTVAASAGALSFTYTPDFNASGNHTLRCTVENGDFSFNRTWAITVRNVDRAPLVSGVSPPAGQVRTVPGTTVVFTATAIDPDGDAVVFSWSEDGRQLIAATNLSLWWNTSGVHVVSLRISAGGFLQTINWSVDVVVVNQPPVLTSADPNVTSLKIDVRVGKVFVVDVSDDGVRPLTVVWKLDGAVVGNGSQYFFPAGGSTVGNHTLVAEISDGEFSSTRGWNVEVTAEAPAVTTGFPTEMLVLLLVIAAVVALAVLQVMFRRRRSE